MKTAAAIGLFSFTVANPLFADQLDISGRDISKQAYHLNGPSIDLGSNSPISLQGIIFFDPYITYPTGSYPEVVAIGDLNNDGLNDVVLGTSYSFDPENDYKVFVFLQNQHGGLEAPHKYDGGDIEAMDVGYINDDSLLDVAIGFGDSVGIYYQNGAGGLDPLVGFLAGDNVKGVAVGDLNNDDLSDLATFSWSSDTMRVFLQQSPGIFESSTPYTISRGVMDEVEIGDVTGDDLDDLIFDSGENIAVMAQDTNGVLLPSVFYQVPDMMTNGIAIGDLNNDGRNDVAVTYGGNTPSAHVAIFLQDPSGSLQEPPVSYECYDIPEPLEIADFDIDGRNDLVTANGGWNTISTYHQDSSGMMEPYRTFDVPYASHYRPQGLAVGDINNDNKPDIALADYNNGLVVLINSSNLGVGEPDPSGSYMPHGIALGQNYPNPFNPTTTISFEIPEGSDQFQTVKVVIHDLRGRFMRTLVNSEYKSGRHSVTWNGRNEQGEKLSSGVYFYTLSVGGRTFTKKMTVVK